MTLNALKIIKESLMIVTILVAASMLLAPALFLTSSSIERAHSYAKDKSLYVEVSFDAQDLKDPSKVKRKPAGSGSGFVYDLDGHYFLVTNRHVCEAGGVKYCKGISNPEIKFVNSSNKSLSFQDFFISEKTDLCYVALDKDQALSLADPFEGASSSPYGEEVFAVGHPGGREDAVTTNGVYVSEGIQVYIGNIETATRTCPGETKEQYEKRIEDYIEKAKKEGKVEDLFYYKSVSTTIPIYSGNSGGAMFNSGGKLVGISTFTMGPAPHGYGVHVVELDLELKKFIKWRKR